MTNIFKPVDPQQLKDTVIKTKTSAVDAPNLSRAARDQLLEVKGVLGYGFAGTEVVVYINETTNLSAIPATLKETWMLPTPRKRA